MMLFLLMLAQAATAAPPPATQKPPPQVIGEGNYPRVAAEHGWQGTARAYLTVSADGTVSACKIVQSTSHKLLDDYVCDTLLRAKFTPAKNENGKPVEGHFLTPPINFN
jgi:protein TonB